MNKDKIIEYFKGVKAEWGKITWPEKKQVVPQTIVVILVVVFFTIFTYSADLVFKWILSALNLQA